MARWVCAATLDDLWDGELLAVKLEDEDVVLCNVNGVVVAFRDCCPHLANPLSKGRLEAHVLVCSAHEWRFDVRDGHGVNPATTCLSAYPVRLEGDRILVDVGGSVR
jgi:toluene monooxygenase system ferredoxin subunit